MSTIHPELKAALDTRLEDAISQANYRLTLNNQRANLRAKLNQSLIYAFNGGIFTISQELISFVTALISSNRESAVLLDKNANPILVDDLTSFRDNILDRYAEVTNQYLLDMKALSKARSTKALVEG